MAEPTSGVNHVGVSVPDLHAAVQWYSTHLQFRLLKGPVHFKRDNTLPRAKDAHIFKIYAEPFEEAVVAYLVSNNGVGLELFEFKEPKQRGAPRFGPDLYTQTGCYHIALTNPDPQGLCERLEKVGASKLAGPVSFGSGPSTILYLEDPWGVVLEICNKTFQEMVLDA